MTAKDQTAGRPVLKRIADSSKIAFTKPLKKINDGDNLTFFLSSTAYRDIIIWVHQLNRSIFPTTDQTGSVSECRLDTPPTYSDTVKSLRALITDLKDLIQKAPPDTGPRRFGNVAFRSWFKLAEEAAHGLLDAHLGHVLKKHEDSDAAQASALRDELQVYLLGSFGSAQRLDYGTGHELSFLAFLACLWKLNAFDDGDERAIVLGVVQLYLELIRTLVLTYTLEPAGSHGVWGLDDHSFAPYIFGSAQLGPAIDSSSPSTPTPTEGSLKTAPSPSNIIDKSIVTEYKDINMYFSAIQFIYDVKKGPFWEHSPVLYDVSGIKDGWGKINKGMLKMYAAEVLDKFPVVQHFPFGSLFAWVEDPDAIKAPSSVHAQQQPRSMHVPPAPRSSTGTQAPWAKPGQAAHKAQLQPSIGVPSMRAPWAASLTKDRTPSPGIATTAAHRSATQKAPAPPPGGATAGNTAAPWAKRQGQQ